MDTRPARIVIIGATGMVGGELLDLALADERVAGVTVIGRRPVEREHAELTQITHRDFADCAPLADAVAGHAAAIFCLGVYTGAVPDDVFRTITVDYPLAFGRVFRAANPDGAFCLLSGAGADQGGTSRMAFARYKGEAEKGLAALDFARLHHYRPAYIHPSSPRPAPNFGYRLSAWLYPVLRRLAPNQVIPSRALAAVMLDGALHGTDDRPAEIENRDVRAIARRIGATL